MSRRFLTVLLLAALPAFSACDGDSASPDVGPSSLAVRAFVDVDGSGAFDEGDTPIVGATIELMGPSGASVTTTTDAQGMASFGGLEPGSYALSYQGEAPAGATLSGATEPVVVVTVLSQDLAAEFRFVNFPGRVEGRLYRDDNGNGTYDEGDTPATGIPVSIYAGAVAPAADEAGGAAVAADEAGAEADEAVEAGAGVAADDGRGAEVAADAEPLASTVTGPDGEFEFGGLRPGTYTLEFEPFPTMDIEGGTTQTVMVGAEATSSPGVTFTGALLSPISDARALAQADEGDVVAVEGVVIWQPSFSDDVFIQDETGGILVYGGAVDAAALGLARGDVVLAVGEAALYFGEPQITNVTTLQVQGTADVPTPETTTAAALNAGEVQHRLVTVEGAEVQAVEELDYGNQFVTLTDAVGNEFGVYADSRTGVEADSWTVGGLYNVTGVPGYDGRYDFPHRIEVRGPEDIVSAEPPVTIAEAKAREIGSRVTVTGAVSWQPSGPDGAAFSDELYIQDATGGIQVYGGAVDARGMDLEPGDVVQLTGVTEVRYGELQITDVESLTVIDTGEVPTPVSVTPAQIASGEFVHQIASVTDATVLSVEEISFGNQLVTLEVPGGELFGVYVDSRTGVTAGDWQVGAVYDVTGVINFDSRYGPYDYRLWIRGAGDILTAGQTLSIAEAKAMALGSEVTVSGVVIWQPSGPDGESFSDELYIQDATAGIQVYAADANVRDLGLEPGDVVRVTGVTENRYGELQITDVTMLTQIGSGADPNPTDATPAEIASGELVHRLVQVEDATVVSVEEINFGNQLVTLEAPGGEQFGVYVDSRTGMTAADWTEGAMVDVTGVVNYDNRYGPFEHRVWVRGTADVVPAFDLITIAEAKAAGEDAEVTVRGTVIWQPVRPDNSSFSDEVYIQDETGGIQVYGGAVDAGDMGLQPGDVVRITGTTEVRYGEFQITDVTALTLIESGAPPAPVAVTPAQIASGERVHELVSVDGATVVAVETIDFGNQLVTLEAPGGEQFGVYVDSRTGVEADHWTVDSAYDIVGVINYDSRYGPFDYRIWIRGAADAAAN